MFFLTPFDSRRYIFPKGGPGPKLAYIKACNVYIFNTFLSPIDLENLTYIFSPPAPLQGLSPCPAMIETHRVVDATNQPTNQQVPLCSGWPGESTGHLPRIRPTAQLSLVVCCFCENPRSAPRGFLDSNPKPCKIDGRLKKQQQQLLLLLLLLLQQRWRVDHLSANKMGST